MDVGRIDTAFENINDCDLPSWMQCLVVLVLSRIKPIVTIEDTNDATIASIKNVATRKNLFSKVVESYGLKKIILGIDQSRCKKLLQLEKKVFGDKIVTHRYQEEYGVLLGYPQCCAKEQFLSPYTNTIGHHFSVHSPWPWNFCFFDGLLFHYPCNPNCVKSKTFGTVHAHIRSKAHKFSFKEVQEQNSGFVLHFGQNLYTFFDGDQSGDMIVVKKIKKTMHNPHREGTDINKELSKQQQFIQSIQNDSVLKISDHSVTVRNNDKTHKYIKSDISDGCLIEFR